MSAIELSSFVNAAQIDSGLDKLHTVENAVTERTSHTAVGGKLLSWAKLNTTGDSQKSADQSRFQEALKDKFGAEVGEAAYNAFAPSDGKSHSLTKTQVLDSVEFGLTKEENNTKQQNKDAGSDILAGTRKTYGDAVAAKVTTLLEGSSKFARTSENTGQLKETIGEIAKGVFQEHLGLINEDITARISQLKEPGALEAIATSASIDIDWGTVSAEDKTALLANLEKKLIKQSHANPQEPKARQFVNDEKVDLATTNQLQILSEIKTALPGSEFFNRVLGDLGLSPEDISEQVQGKLADDLSHELQIILGEDGTKEIKGDLKSTEKKIILQAVSMALLKDVSRAEAKTPEFTAAISHFDTEGDPKTTAYLEKLLSHLARSQVEADMLAGKSFSEVGGVAGATKAEVWNQLTHLETASNALEEFVGLLADQELDASKFGEVAKSYAENAKSSGADDIGKILDIQLNKIFKEQPEAKQQLLQAVENGQLLNHANALGAGINLLRDTVENQLIVKANRDGIDPDYAVLEVNTLTATATRPIDYLLSNFVATISNQEKLPVVNAQADLANLSETGQAQKDVAVKHNEQVDQKYNSIMQAFADPQEDKENGSKVAAGLALNLQDQFRDYGITVTF
ncbi:hypothetical protein [Pseudovibrio sp. Tun.PSC04-5.I4]|uniref:hypothetical protein n=1 Tax=Pseudovibrio sp. Tun.PSC04-5.I4 TaxID=1798213 RepID=UPI0008836E59|nr:hypothetical protein [Pseudovibrio sp. Tun.PSC04-5.I4]SDR30860.1 hypothetical protein SAMN04515695_4337 [Pseudovibrio sp. Tun.PSC04-5.I4]